MAKPETTTEIRYPKPKSRGDRTMNNEILETLEVEEMEEVVAPGWLLGD
jgi:hypothetical protein